MVGLEKLVEGSAIAIAIRGSTANVEAQRVKGVSEFGFEGMSLVKIGNVMDATAVNYRGRNR